MLQTLDKESLIDFIKNNHQDATINKRGQLILRLNKEQFIPKSHSSYAQVKLYKLSPVILHPDDRLARRDLYAWIATVEHKLTMYLDLKVSSEMLEGLAQTLNHLPLILCFLNKFDQAIQVCEKTIEIFSKLALNEDTKIAIKHAIQPWINLGRIDRLAGRNSNALRKFLLLSQFSTIYPNHTNTTLTESYVLTALNAVYGKDEQITTVIENCSIIERIKTYFKMREYQELKSELKNFVADKIYKKSVIYEAEVAVNAALGDFKSAYEMCYAGLAYGAIECMHIFAFRLAEICYILGFSEELEAQLEKIEEHISSLASMDMSDIAYLDAVAGLYAVMGNTKKACKVGMQAVRGYRQQQDVFGEILMLRKLSSYFSCMNKRHLAEKIINKSDTLACESGYNETFNKTETNLQSHSDRLYVLFNKLVSIHCDQ